MSNWQELTIFVHGITCGEGGDGPHTETYEKFAELINQSKNKEVLDKNGFIMVEWGWDDGLQHQEPDKYLAKAEANVAKAMWDVYSKSRNLTWNIFGRSTVSKLRNIFLHGISDMFYYVSEQGEQAVRRNIFTRILKTLASKSADIDNISLLRRQKNWIREIN